MTRRLIAGTGWKMNVVVAETVRWAARLTPLVDGLGDAYAKPA